MNTDAHVDEREGTGVSRRITNPSNQSSFRASSNKLDLKLHFKTDGVTASVLDSVSSFLSLIFPIFL